MHPTTFTIAIVRCAPTAGKSRSNMNCRWSAFDGSSVRVLYKGFMYCTTRKEDSALIALSCTSVKLQLVPSNATLRCSVM